jgi:two-component system, NarL family, nitrate/nitrite response regulator NarL
MTSMKRQVTVLVGDGQPLFLDAIARVIRQDVGLALVREVADGREALGAIHELAPDVAVLGVPLDGLGVARLAATIARDGLRTRVVALLPEPDAGAAFEMVAAGAAACLTRAVDPAALRRAVFAAAGGETVLAAELQTGLAREIRLRHRERGPLLTTREREVLGLVADGRSTAQIAGRLHLSPTTIKTHLANAYEKLGVSDRAAAVAAGMRRGLLD